MTAREKRFIDEKFLSEAGRNDAYRRLEKGEPLAYILREWYFYDETYTITPAVLVPQPDTELLVENAINLIPQFSRFVDLCTGSGCIAISVLRHRPDLTALAVDISLPALDIARKNAKRNGISERIEFLCSDICSPGFIKNLGGKFSAILSNPPYIASNVIKTLSPEVRAEPEIALDGGDDGLRFYRAINSFYKNILCANSIVLLEIGYDQASAVKQIFGGGRVLCDYSGNDRLYITSVQ